MKQIIPPQPPKNPEIDKAVSEISTSRIMGTFPVINKKVATTNIGNSPASKPKNNPERLEIPAVNLCLVEYIFKERTMNRPPNAAGMQETIKLPNVSDKDSRKTMENITLPTNEQSKPNNTPKIVVRIWLFVDLIRVYHNATFSILYFCDCCKQGALATHYTH